MEEAVLNLDEIPDGGAVRVEVDGKEIAVFRKSSEVYAIDAKCPHRGGPLDEPLVNDYIAVCPWHCWDFDIRTGRSPGNPARVGCHPVTIDGTTVRVRRGV